MYCIHCGAKNPVGAKFCGECGKLLPSRVIEQLNQGEIIRSSRGERRSWLIVSGVVLGVIAVAAVVIIGGLSFLAPKNRISLKNASEVKQLNVLNGHAGLVDSVAFSPNGKTLASGSFDNTVRLWNVADGELIRVLQHDDRVGPVAFSPSGTLLASGSKQLVRIWNTVNGDLQQTLEGHIGIVYGVAFSPDGTKLVSAGGDYGDDTVRLWDVNTGELLHIFETPDREPTFSVAFHKDGTTIAVGSYKKAYIWDINSYHLDQILDMTSYGNVDVVNSVAFSPNGHTLATAVQGAVFLWDTKTGYLLSELADHIIDAEGVAFSPDGQVLASTDNDGTIRLWDVERGQLITRLYGHSDWAFGVAFNPEGTRLASASRDQSIILWGIEP